MATNSILSISLVASGAHDWNFGLVSEELSILFLGELFFKVHEGLADALLFWCTMCWGVRGDQTLHGVCLGYKTNHFSTKTQNSANWTYERVSLPSTHSGQMLILFTINQILAVSVIMHEFSGPRSLDNMKHLQQYSASIYVQTIFILHIQLMNRAKNPKHSGVKLK